MRTVRLRIKGKVQGVYFRVSARQRAELLQLTGWVRNTEKDVEAVVSGDDQMVESFVSWAQKGPERAIVERVDVKEEPFRTFECFQIKRGTDY